MKRWLRRGAIILAVMALLGSAAVFWGWTTYRAPGPLSADSQHVIPRGGAWEIGAELQSAGIVSDARLFGFAAWLTRREGRLRAAEFAFPAGASLEQVLHILRRARPVQRRVTLAEGLTVRQIAVLLERAEGLTGEIPSIAEGAILPETYAYQWGDTRAGLLRRAEAAMTQALTELWAERVPNLPLASQREALILASIVERETGVAEERPRVAAVFLNRLRRGMRLQSDPTVVYAASNGAGVLERPISRADLERDHPFNTYRVQGLPPAPIAAPGRDALRAVLRPSSTEDLYFVADGSGGHAFARTIEEHNRNVTRWREIERQRAGGGAAQARP